MNPTLINQASISAMKQL